MQVLGVSRGVNSDAVNRAYKVKITEARGNDAEKARIENAHSTIMMSQLSARMKAGAPYVSERRYSPVSSLSSFCVCHRQKCYNIHPVSHGLSLPAIEGALLQALWFVMQGGVEVAKDIRFADKAVYFPWRPR